MTSGCGPPHKPFALASSGILAAGRSCAHRLLLESDAAHLRQSQQAIESPSAAICISSFWKRSHLRSSDPGAATLSDSRSARRFEAHRFTRSNQARDEATLDPEAPRDHLIFAKGDLSLHIGPDLPIQTYSSQKATLHNTNQTYETNRRT